MFKAKYTTFFAHCVIVLTGSLSAFSVWAAVPPPPELLSLPWVQIAIAGVIALWGGVGRTAVRAIEDAQERRDKPGTTTGFSLKSELLKDVFVSSGLGFVVYLLGVHQEWNAWLLAPALWMSGYLGTKLIAGMGNAVLNYIGQLGNKEKP